jgi:ribonuclease-3
MNARRKATVDLAPAIEAVPDAVAPKREKPVGERPASEKPKLERTRGEQPQREDPRDPAPEADKLQVDQWQADKPQSPKSSADTAKPKKSAGRSAAKRRSAANKLEERIGYRFKDADLLERALTHVSALKGPRNPIGSYQRLEFLGDHVLGLVVSDMLFRTFERANEGELSRRLAELVRKDACADVARAFDLGAAIRLGSSEVQTGGRRRASILADVCEALIGAVFLDGGYPAAEEVIHRFWHDRMITPVRPLRDAKTVLQEWAQGRGLPTPTYREVARTGPHHDPEFRIAVELPNRPPAEGVGRSKRAAEQAAAATMLEREGVAADLGKPKPASQLA